METIAIDLDATIWNSSDKVLERLHQLTGDVVDPEDYTDYYYLFDRYGKEFAIDLFDSVCADSSFVSDRPLYPDVVETIEELKNHYRVVFVTHNGRPVQMYEPLKKWLDSLFGNSHLLMVPHKQSKVDVMEIIGANLICDDRPQTLEEAYERDYQGFTLIHPYNRKQVEDGVAVGFNTWDEVPELLIGERV